ncbi:hydrogenase maturation protein [Maricurvus nonylphenolicus]|uniref:enoyl-CoA hydratase-related protein n=1 Tax=Maricurvus nonylphenolicus TaxID=1008307 RepID=UPI0036F23F0F
MRILLLASAFNGLSQRVYRELDLLHHQLELLLSKQGKIDTEAIFVINPDLIICPLLKEYIPAEIWQNYRCLIVHPGIKGDRGPSSLDWALIEGQTSWGVTLLQADQEMDAGDIWGSREFPMRTTSKASLYRREVTHAAVDLIKQALEQIQHNSAKPIPLNYASADVRGYWHDPISQSDRAISWQQPSKDIVRHINAADSQPGLRVSLSGELFLAYGAKQETRLYGEPGEIIGQANGALCVATQDSAVWLRQLKATSLNAIKLPASLSLNLRFGEDQLPDIRHMDHFHSDIKVTIAQHVAYIEFDFYNGAMDTLQCRKLITEIRKLKLRADIRVMVFMGGEDFWSNGIHLNIIEVSESPGRTSWTNIHAIDDLVAEIILSPNHITVAALRCNAGAGGAVMAMACDRVAARDGVIMTPYYSNMGLHGSEYWRYLMPKRAGLEATQRIRKQAHPLLASEALAIGLVDEIFNEDWQEYHHTIEQYAKALAKPDCHKDILAYKQIIRSKDEAEQPLQVYRNEALAIMQQQFFDPDSEYHRLRHNFVHKIETDEVPVGSASSNQATG